jgi:Holliday junction resolvase
VKHTSLGKGLKVTEKSIINQIEYGPEVHGWHMFRVPPSIYSAKGLCDLIAVKHGVTVFIEAKTPKGKQSDDQKIFESRVKNAGASYILARSVDDVEHLFRFRGTACRA